MSVALDVNTITTTLWPTPTKKVVRSTGLFLEVNLVSRGASRFTHVVFDPNDEATFYASTTEAVVYLFSFRGNVVRLFATFEYSVSAMACCNSEANPLLVCATEDLTLLWLDCKTSRIVRRAKTPHMHIVQMVRVAAGFGAPWLATLSREMLAVWDTTQMICQAHSHMTTPNIVHDFAGMYAEKRLVVTLEQSGIVRAWDPSTLLPTKAVTVEMRPRAAAGCQKYLAVGGADALVGFLKLPDLSPICCVQVSTAPVATRSLSIINDDLLACELTNGSIIFVVVNSYTVAFAMTAPYLGAMRQNPTFFSFSGPSFGVCVHGEQLAAFHLPTARQHYMLRAWGDGVASSASLPQQSHSFVRRRVNTRGHSPGRAVGEATGDTTLPRPAIRPSKAQVSKWTRVDLLPQSQHATKTLPDRPSDASSSPSAAPFRGRNAKEEAMGEKEENEMGISQRSLLDKTSRAANMENLKGLLVRYGVFPDKYRPLIWRFLLQLPEKRFTAPQYAQLLSKGMHDAVPCLVKPFPLTNKKERSAMESALSIFAWHLPMFSVINFLPMLVYPFLQVYGSDIQSTVEIMLVFLLNWGQEFFQYYPQPPVALMSLLNQLLCTEDAELHKHLELRGIVVESWGWETLRSLYTDILTPATWLQVMDHAFFNRPLWLFLFYIQWLIHIREKLLKCDEQGELMDILFSTHSLDVNRVIADTYQLYERCPKGELTRPYEKLHAFVDYAYPVDWKHDKDIITQRVTDVQKSLHQKEQTKELSQRIYDVREQLTEAETLEKVFVEKKRAQLAAQLSTANESWKHEVACKKERQQVRDMENMTRVRAVRQQLQQADLLDAFQEELASVQLQVAGIEEVKKRETSHWQRSERLTDYELQRLENAARERLAKAMRSIEEHDEKKNSTHLREDEGLLNQPRSSPLATTITTTLPTATENPQMTEVGSGPLQAYRALRGCVTREINKTPQSFQKRRHSLNERSTIPSYSSPFVTSSGRVAPSSTLYDNMLDEGVSRGRGETRRP